VQVIARGKYQVFIEKYPMLIIWRWSTPWWRHRSAPFGNGIRNWLRICNGV
jgi:hypothetical protein